MILFRFSPLRHATKTLAALLSFLLAVGALLASCANDDPVNVNEINKQTVLVFMPWTGNDNDEQGRDQTGRGDTADAAEDLLGVEFGGRWLIKKKKKRRTRHKKHARQKKQKQ
mgnify:CR=1 FL=1